MIQNNFSLIKLSLMCRKRASRASYVSKESLKFELKFELKFVF